MWYGDYWPVVLATCTLMQCHSLERGFLVGIGVARRHFSFIKTIHPNEHNLSIWLKMLYTLATTRLQELSTFWGLLSGNCLQRQLMRHEKTPPFAGWFLSH